MSPEKTAELLAKVYNSMARENGWPPAAETGSLLRNRKILTAVEKGIGKASEIPHGRSPETLVGWVLSRWNWNRSPAPIALAGSMAQWDALAASLAREAEETQETRTGRLAAVAAWVEKEMRVRDGIDKPKIKKEIEEYAQATGKIRSWTAEEQNHFYLELERA